MALKRTVILAVGKTSADASAVELSFGRCVKIIEADSGSGREGVLGREGVGDGVEDMSIVYSVGKAQNW